MPDVNRGNRPLSPFMIGPYYRPQLTSMSSILVRITGIGLLIGMVFVVWWLLAAASSEAAFSGINWFMTSWLGDLLLFAATWAIFYHMLGRLRHVIWDFGHCLEVETSEKLAIAMFVLATALTIIVVLVV